MKQNAKKWIVVAGVLIGLLLLQGVVAIKAYFEYQKTINAEWELADRSSTIAAKREHIDKFIANVEKCGLEGTYDALLFPNETNGFDANLIALKTLQARLHEIEGMDIRSFEYQTAIQQITAQEQGEAQSMLQTIEGTWWKKFYLPVYGLVGMTITVGLFTCVIWIFLFKIFH